MTVEDRVGQVPVQNYLDGQRELVTHVPRAAQGPDARECSGGAVDSVIEAVAPEEAVLRYEVNAPVQPQPQCGRHVEQVGGAEQAGLTRVRRSWKQRAE